MLFPKFIVEEDAEIGMCLIMGKVSYHKQLTDNPMNKVKGGGWFKFIPEESKFVFSGSSEDFGAASIEDIKQCVLNHTVFTNKYKTHYIGNKFKFCYDTGSELIEIEKPDKPIKGFNWQDATP